MVDILDQVFEMHVCFGFQGKRNEEIPEGEFPQPELYEIRANGGLLCRRCVQVGIMHVDYCWYAHYFRRY